MSEDKKTIEELKSELEQSRMMCDRLRESNRREVAQIYDSLSWRITAPLRYLGGFMMNGGGDSIGYLSLKSRKALIHKYGRASFPDGSEKRKQREDVTKFSFKPVFSILVPVYNTPKRYLKEMIESVLNQSYPYWELCIADASDAEHSYVGSCIESYVSKYNSNEHKILYKRLDENLGISGNTNECLALATGDYIGLFDHDDVLHPSLLYEYAKEINETGADFLYCDELTFKGNNIDQIITLHLKPDYSRYTLFSNNYICHFTAFKRTLLENGEGFRSEYDGSQDYDIILRLTNKATKISHIHKVLYYWRSHPGSTAAGIGAKNYAVGAGRKALENRISQEISEDIYVSSVFVRDTIYRTRYSIKGNPKVLVLVDNENSKNTITSSANYGLCNAVIMSHYGSDEIKNMLNGYDQVAIVRGDIREISMDWAQQLLMYSQLADVGVVGGLAHDGGNIIDAGIALTDSNSEGYEKLYYGKNVNKLGYMARLTYVHELTGFRGTFFMCKSGLFLNYEASKLQDESEFIKWCLELGRMGKHNVFTPFAILDSSISMDNRGLSMTLEGKEAFYTDGLFDGNIFGD